MLGTAANRGWRIKKMDITTAFLNGIILEELYMLQPEGLDDESGRVCRLKKAIYGLKQAPRAWYHKLEETLLAGGFKKRECDHSLFLLQEKEQFLMLLVYVDDILLFSESSSMIERVEEMLEMHFNAVRQRQQRGAADLGKGEMLLTCYTDASFNSVKADGTSIGGYVCPFGGGAVSRRNKKQNEVGLSSCETEYMVLHHGVKEVVWLRRLLEEIGVCQREPTMMFCDNEALDGVLLGAGWKKSQVDTTLYFKADDDGVTCWVLVYIDDLLAANSSTAMLKELLQAAFELLEISPVVKYFGLEMMRDRPARKLWLHQQNYADKLRRRFIDEEQGGRVPKTPVWAVKAAMEEEIHSLIGMGTWELVERPHGVNIMKNRWVLTTKYHIDNTVEREMARLVVNGFTQVYGADYDETYSPVSNYVMLRIFLRIVAVLDLNLMQLDMKNVFLQSKLDQVLYMYKPDYFDDGTSQKSQVDTTLYFKAGGDRVTCWVLVYVDDLLAASSSTAILKELEDLLEAAFELREILPVVKYLGLEIMRDRPVRKLWLHKQHYTDKLLRRFIDEEQGGRVPKTPVSVDAYAKLTFDDKEAQEREEEEYQRKVGSLQFAAMTTMLDITFACSKLGSGLTVRSNQHWREVDHCLAYLADTRDTAPEFGGGPEFLELIGLTTRCFFRASLLALPRVRLVTTSWYAPSKMSSAPTYPTPLRVALVASSNASDSSIAPTLSVSGGDNAAVVAKLSPAAAVNALPTARGVSSKAIAPRVVPWVVVVSAYDGVLDSDLFETAGNLGRGGFGMVPSCHVVMRRLESGEVVAVKRVARKQMVAAANEAMVAASLSECPGVLGVREVHLANHHAYVLSDICSGSDLRTLLQRCAAASASAPAEKGKGRRWWGKAAKAGGEGEWRRRMRWKW
ncbi:unnamed protein product [Closterium sp. NIES-53]